MLLVIGIRINQLYLALVDMNYLMEMVRVRIAVINILIIALHTMKIPVFVEAVSLILLLGVVIIVIALLGTIYYEPDKVKIVFTKHFCFIIPSPHIPLYNGMSFLPPHPTSPYLHSIL